jgi:hypothetical protein
MHCGVWLAAPAQAAALKPQRLWQPCLHAGCVLPQVLLVQGSTALVTGVLHACQPSSARSDQPHAGKLMPPGARGCIVTIDYGYTDAQRTVSLMAWHAAAAMDDAAAAAAVL